MNCVIFVFAWLSTSYICSFTTGCHYYRDGEAEEQERRKKRTTNIIYNANNTGFLRNYFTACMTSKISNPVYDWRSIVDFTVLDSLWHLNTLQTHCSPAAGGSTSSCWQREIENFLRANIDNVRIKAQSCIADFAEDSGQIPPINRYASVLQSRGQRLTDENRPNISSQLPNFNGIEQLPSYDSCLELEVSLQGVRDSLSFKGLSFFIERNIINLCDGGARHESFVTTQWPYRFIALTRPDTPLRDPLESCAVQVFPPDSFWSDWSGWSSCSKSCNKGMETRRRTCRFGKDPRMESNECLGPSKNRRACQKKKCPPIYYSWGSWSSFTRCSKNCGGGHKHRTRACYRSDNSSPISKDHCAHRLHGTSTEYIFCNIFACHRYYYHQRK